jgi:hypothetical protein
MLISRSHRRILAAVPLLAMIGLMSGCGSSTTGDSATSAPAASSAAASPASSAPVGADAPFVTTDCAVADVGVASDVAPSVGDTYGPVTVSVSETGVPIVSIAAAAPPTQELESYDLLVGDGAEATEGATITFNYCGIGMQTRTLFDSSWTRGQPLTYGLNELIPGWGLGLPGMKVGGQRLLIIPGDLAYGPNPNPDSGILPNETLVFVVELVDVVS